MAFPVVNNVISPSRTPEHTHNFISCLILAAQNGFGRDVEPFLALSRETWGEEVLWDAVKDLRNGSQRTRLMYAAHAGNVERLRWLLARGAGVDLRCHTRRTALQWASQEGHLQVVRELLAWGAAINTADIVGWTSLCRASHNGHGRWCASCSRGAPR